MPQTTLIIPGLNGSGPGHWQDHWLNDHADAQWVEQEDWACPRIEDWMHRLEAELVAHPGAILVAHSLGTLLVAHLAQRPAHAHVGGALLVAPCDLSVVRRLHPGTTRFGAMPTDPLPFPALVVGSSNDPYLDLADAQTLADQWNAPFFNLGAAGHINVASGYGRWEDGYALASAFSRAPRSDRMRGLPGAGAARASHGTWSSHGRETLAPVMTTSRPSQARAVRAGGH